MPLDKAMDLKKPFTAGTAYKITEFTTYNKDKKSRNHRKVSDLVYSALTANLIGKH